MRTLFVAGCRVLGVFLALRTISSLVSIVSLVTMVSHSFPGHGIGRGALYMLLWLGTALFAVWLTIRKPEWIADRLGLKDEAIPEINPENVLSIGIRLIGVWFMMKAIGHFSGFAVWATTQGTLPEMPRMHEVLWLFEAVPAMFLILRGSALAGFIMRGEKVPAKYPVIISLILVVLFILAVFNHARSPRTIMPEVLGGPVKSEITSQPVHYQRIQPASATTTVYFSVSEPVPVDIPVSTGSVPMAE